RASRTDKLRLLLRKHLRREDIPLLFQRERGHSLAGTPIPSTGVPHVAFLAMQVRVHPIAVPLSFVLLDAFMRPLPVAATRPPQRLQGGPDIGWRHLSRHAASEGIDGCHDRTIKTYPDHIKYR